MSAQALLQARLEPLRLALALPKASGGSPAAEPKLPSSPGPTSPNPVLSGSPIGNAALNSGTPIPAHASSDHWALSRRPLIYVQQTINARSLRYGLLFLNLTGKPTDCGCPLPQSQHSCGLLGIHRLVLCMISLMQEQMPCGKAGIFLGIQHLLCLL